jgi:hypothetical protein
MYNGIKEYEPFHYIVECVDDEGYDESNITNGKQYVACAIAIDKGYGDELYVFDTLNPFNDFDIPDTWRIFNNRYLHFNACDFDIIKETIDMISNMTLVEAQKKLCQMK